MKGHTGRKHRETGGANEAEADEKDKPKHYTADSNVEEESEERKRGGRAKRRRGGKTELGKVEGEKGPMHAGRKPRKAGGAAEEKHDRGEAEYDRARGGRAHRARGGGTSDANPFTSARKGEDGPGRKVMKGELGFGED